ncbi:MAG: FAD/NAD(P)-binding protein, partial [Candidatus Sericytochromatia bacterium]
MENLEHVEVAIVGGGFAGSMVAASLLAHGRGPMRLALIERRMPPGRGVAHGTGAPSHLLNIPAGEMSAWPEDPGHFERWLAARGHTERYASRGLYGAYVEEALKEAAAVASEGRTLTLYEDEAIGCLPEGQGYRLRLRSGRILYARQV